MEQELKEGLSLFLQKSLAILEQGQAFVSEQIPLVLQEILMWYGVKSFVFFSFGILFLLPVIWWVRFFFKDLGEMSNQITDWVRTEDSHRPEKRTVRSKLFEMDHRNEVTPQGDGGLVVLGWIVSFVLAIVSTFLWTSNLDWLKVILAPRLYLIEYLSHLAKTIT